MRKLPKIITFNILFSILIQFVHFGFVQCQPAFAQYSLPKASQQTEVKATVGEFYLEVSGWIAPFASVIMTSNGVFLRATVADENGNFYFAPILIKKGFSSFCLTAIDYKRLGESMTCFSFPPAKGSIVMKDIFLPPTLGLSRAEVPAGSSVKAFGYTMPFALVTLDMNGVKLTTTADKDGYYEFNLTNLKAGTYKLFANAEYKGKTSLSPTKYLQLKALSLWEQFLALLRDLWKKIVRLFTSIGLGPLWLGLPILILIIILILKIWPERFTFIYESKLARFLTKLLRRQKRLHHWWWMGY